MSRVVARLNELASVKCLEQFLAGSKRPISINVSENFPGQTQGLGSLCGPGLFSNTLYASVSPSVKRGVIHLYEWLEDNHEMPRTLKRVWRLKRKDLTSGKRDG